MHFLLTNLKVVYVLSTPCPEVGDNAPVGAFCERNKWDNDDYIARGHILNGMSDPLFDLYQNVESAKELWDTLEAKYMAEDASSVKFLVSNFNNYKMVDSRPVMEQFHEIQCILGQFAQRNLKMDEAISVSSIIDKLPPAWKDFHRTLKHKKEDISLVELVKELRMEEELRVREKDSMEVDTNLPKVNVLETSSQKMNKNKGKKRPNEYVSKGPNKRKHPSKENVCWTCGKAGHFKRDCRVGKGKREKAQDKAFGNKNQEQKSQGQNLLVSDLETNVDAQSDIDYVSNFSEIFALQDDETSWWVDSGVTTHVCRDNGLFKSFATTSEGRVIHMGDESTAPILGLGRVELEFSSGKTVVLCNVLFVPNIRKNIVSGTVLNKQGYRQVYEADKYVLSKGGIFVGKGYLCNGMFKLSLNENICSIYMNYEHEIPTRSTSSHVDISTLWHARLGYVHYKRLLKMSKHDLIPSFDMNIDRCRTCMLTKITRQPFYKVTRESNIIDLIHSDLCDFHASPSLGNKKYVVTYIDDCSRFCYVYLLHSKDEDLDKFQIYKSEVELQKGTSIKKLRTDRGREYFFPNYFQSVGIIHETTAPYTPQQNGVSERKNRVLKEMVNAMLSYSGLNDGFWGEAMLTACYLLNRVPNNISNLTPYEIWHGKKPSLAHVKVWGCRAVVRLPLPKIKTLGEKGVECIFIGYAQHSLAYRFYVIEPNKQVPVHTIIESRDSIFDEKRFSSISMPRDLVLAPSIVQESSEPQISENRRSKRTRKGKTFGDDFQMYLVEGTREDIGLQYSYCHIIEDEPKTFDEAMKSQDVSFWKEAINDEMDSIVGNNTWILVDLPQGHKALGNKWIFRKKMKVDGTIEKFKARLVIQGFRQKFGLDYFDTYAPVARISTIRLLIALASIHKLIVHQMDVKTAFLNGDLEEEIYMKQRKVSL
ncbi:unnamed protein product [Rhodiola kirilowii]